MVNLNTEQQVKNGKSMTPKLYKPNRFTKKVKLNIVMEIVASNYLAQQLKDDLEYKVLQNCFNTNDRQLLSVKLS